MARLLPVLALAFALRVPATLGPRTGDELYYHRAAARLADGVVPPGRSPLDLRIAHVAGAALGQALAGPGRLATAWVGLTASLGSIALLFAMVRRLHSERAALGAALALALLPLDVITSTSLFADVPSCALAALACFLYVGGRPAAAGAALGAAHLFKETAFFGLIFLALVAARRRDPRPWLRTAAVFAVAVAVEAGAYAVLLDDPLARWRPALSGGHHAIMLAKASEPGWIADRLLLQLPAILFWPGSHDFPLLALTGAAAVASLAAGRPVRFFAAWAATMLALVNFWPNSLVPYAPGMEMAGRYLTVASVPLAGMIGIGLAEGWHRRAVRWAAAFGAGAHLAVIVASVVYLNEAGGRLSPVAEMAAARRPLCVVTDGHTYFALAALLPADVDVRPYQRPGPYGERTKHLLKEARTVVVLHELNDHYHAAVGRPMPPPAPTWRLLHEETRSCALHRMWTGGTGRPPPPSGTYRLRVYEVRNDPLQPGPP